MSDALPLPPRPNLEQYKKLAKDFQHACKSSAPGAIRDWAARWAETIAGLQGLEITPEVRRRIDFEAEPGWSDTGTISSRRMNAPRDVLWPPRNSSSRAGTGSRAGRSLPDTLKGWRALIRRSRRSKRRWTRSSTATWQGSRSC